MAKKNKSIKYRRTVTVSPDQRARTITISSRDKLSKEEFLHELIIYLSEQESIMFDCTDDYYMAEGDAKKLH
jgi:hypothetical protein